MSQRVITADMYDSLQRQYDEILDELETKKSLIKENEHFAQAEIAKLKKAADSDRKKITELEKQNASLKEALKTEQKNNEELKKATATSNKQDAGLTKRIRELEIDNDQLESSVRCLTDLSEDLTRQRDEYVERLAEQTTLMQDMEEKYRLELEMASNLQEISLSDFSHSKAQSPIQTKSPPDVDMELIGDKPTETAKSPSINTVSSAGSSKAYMIVRELLDIIEKIELHSKPE